MLEKILDINAAINNVVWGVPMLIIVVGTGLYYTLKLNFFQFRKFKYAWKNLLHGISKKDSASGSITPVQALTTALASCVGTGNVAGVVGAISLGGPGALLWMELVACVGMITQFAEITLAIKFREKNDKGDWVGGPMYYIKNGLGENWKWLAFLFALFGVLACPGTGNLIQINAIVVAVVSAFNSINPATADYNTMIRLIVGIIVAAILMFVYIGGIKRIGRVAERVVPFMAALYIIAGFVIIILNIGRLPSVISSIFVGAFNPRAVLGGVAGIAFKDTLRRGISRGVNSNEAGMGSAPLGHAAAETNHPVQQGLYGIIGVFMDTIIVCTMTGFIILMSGVEIPYGTSLGVQLTINAFATTFGAVGSSLVMAIILSFFCFSTILGWGLYGARCAEYLWGSKAIIPYQVLFCLILIIGAVMDLQIAWDITDTLNALMIFPNIIALLLLSPVVINLVKEYFADKN